jgi:hypothetical protein
MFGTNCIPDLWSKGICFFSGFKFSAFLCQFLFLGGRSFVILFLLCVGNCMQRSRRAKLVLELARIASTGIEWGLCPPEFPTAASNEDGLRQADVGRTRRHKRKSAKPNPSLIAGHAPKINLSAAPELGWKPARSALWCVVGCTAPILNVGGVS